MTGLYEIGHRETLYHTPPFWFNPKLGTLQVLGKYPKSWPELEVIPVGVEDIEVLSVELGRRESWNSFVEVVDVEIAG